MLVIERQTPDQPEVWRLLVQADARSASLYPLQNRSGLSPAELVARDVRFFVAHEAGHVVGCGGYALVPPGLAELKRIFVVPEARGRGVGRRIIVAIEQAARTEGIEGVLLETGVKSTEAIGLYRLLGYAERPPFGDNGPDPLSVFMEKAFAPP